MKVIGFIFVLAMLILSHPRALTAAENQAQDFTAGISPDNSKEKEVYIHNSGLFEDIDLSDGDAVGYGESEREFVMDGDDNDDPNEIAAD